MCLKGSSYLESNLVITHKSAMRGAFVQQP
jgi:hypothetical protein